MERDITEFRFVLAANSEATAGKTSVEGKNNIKVCLKEIVLEGIDWALLAKGDL